MLKLTASSYELYITCLCGIVSWVGGPAWSRSLGLECEPCLCSFGLGTCLDPQWGQASSWSWPIQIFISCHGNGAGCWRGNFSQSPMQGWPRAWVPSSALWRWLILSLPSRCIAWSHCLPWTTPYLGCGCAIGLELGSLVYTPKSFDLYTASSFTRFLASSCRCG